MSGPDKAAGNGNGNGGELHDAARDAKGRFGLGNHAGRGNPMMIRAHQLRAALFASVTDADLREVIARMLADAKDGDQTSARLLLERLLGRPREEPNIEEDALGPRVPLKSFENALDLVCSSIVREVGAERARVAMERLGVDLAASDAGPTITRWLQSRCE